MGREQAFSVRRKGHENAQSEQWELQAKAGSIWP